jgi:flagellar FliJ protein
MARFKFRLQKLYEFRQKQEEWAKDVFTQARARRLDSGEELARLLQERKQAAQAARGDLRQRITLGDYLEKCDDDIRAVESAIAVLEQEEEQRKEEWLAARRDAAALEKLREQAYTDWLYEENRKEQNEMDEWAVMRRAA